MAVDWTKYDIKKAREIAKRFGATAVAQMAANIQNLGLVEKGNLLRSLKANVRARDGEIDRVTFVYEFYGKFHEIGVDDAFGKAVSIRETKWRSDAIDKHKGELDREFAEFYGALILDEIQIASAKLKM